ncbi:MAG: hypothetical protein KME59_05980 [Trichormus sp. ATA11-4-KO1]|jgi:DNA-directed RNA polymerase subunit M/transcription elongation factor TFIIS|nr:hypothetical protein [Trichormus sp. ATA11-4-KO1]
MNYCPCCSGILLPHIRVSGIAWFCRHCWQDMPVYSWENSSSLAESVVEELPINRQNRENHRIYASQRKTITGWIGRQNVPA